MLLDGKEVTDREGNPVRDPSELETDAEWVRIRLAGKPVEGQIKTPDDIISDLEWAKYLAARSAVIIRDADRTLRALQRLYIAAELAVMKKSSAKSIEERKAEAQIELPELFAAVEEGEIVFEFAKRVAKSVESSTSAIQTQSKQVEITYHLAGSGRGQ